MKKALYISSLLFLAAWIACCFVLHWGFQGYIFLVVSALLAMQGLLLCPKTTINKESVS
ncbi:hypothetical protein JMG10_09415 [Nostoc ellipsosporum NOK]|jgi:type III secretory pathway component EscV|nr:hypothetical protein [Nostoc ellipsosporum NOK]